MINWHKLGVYVYNSEQKQWHLVKLPAPSGTQRRLQVTKHTADISAEDRKFLTDNGFVEGQPHTIPRNISPVLKSQLLQEMGYPGDGSSPNAGDLNPPDGHNTGYVGDGQKDEGQQTSLAKEDAKGKKQDATKAKK